MLENRSVCGHTYDDSTGGMQRDQIRRLVNSQTTSIDLALLQDSPIGGFGITLIVLDP